MPAVVNTGGQLAAVGQPAAVGPRQPPAWTSALRAKALYLRESGASTKRIAQEFGTSRANVRNVLRIARAERSAQASGQPVRARYAQGKSPASLANLTPGRKRPTWPDALCAKLASQRAQGASWGALAAQESVTRATVERRVERWHVCNAQKRKAPAYASASAVVTKDNQTPMSAAHAQTPAPAAAPATQTPSPPPAALTTGQMAAEAHTIDWPAIIDALAARRATGETYGQLAIGLPCCASNVRHRLIKHGYAQLVSDSGYVEVKGTVASAPAPSAQAQAPSPSLPSANPMAPALEAIARRLAGGIGLDPDSPVWLALMPSAESALAQALELAGKPGAHLTLPAGK